MLNSNQGLLNGTNVYAHVMLSEDSYTPKIELKSDLDTLSSFLVQAVTEKNYGVRIVDILDRHICDVELVNFGIFRELRFFYSDASVKDLTIKTNDLFKKYEEDSSCKLPNCTIQNLDLWKEYIDNATDTTVKEDLNKRVYSNFKLL